MNDLSPSRDGAAVRAGPEAIGQPSNGRPHRAYALCGAGYIAYMTFVIAFLRAEHFAPSTVSTFWTVLGLASVATGFGWGLRARAAAGRLAACGGARDARHRRARAARERGRRHCVPFRRAVRRLTDGGTRRGHRAGSQGAARQPTWTSEIGWLTVLFGIGQRIGPLLASALSDTPSGVWLGLLVSVAILALAAVIAALQRDAEQRVT